MNDEALLKKAYEIYVTEGRKEANELVASGALVNYREFPYNQFVDAGTNPENPWHDWFKKNFDYLLEKAKNG